jgi:hypothetical protein
MERPKFFVGYLGFAFCGALAYGFAAFYFIQQAQYRDTWVLYVGNFLFMAVIVGFLFYLSRKMEAGMKTLPLIKAGILTTTMGIIFSLLISAILLLVLVHGILGRGVPGRVMTGKPANTIQDRTNGLDFMVVVNSIIGNFVTGAFVSLIFAGSLYKNKHSKRHSLSQ